MSHDKLGDRMKAYEKREDIPLQRGLPIICRLDGVAFHTYTKGLERPYDMRFLAVMQETTKKLVEATNAVVGYTQSDEITLVIFNRKGGETYFGNKRSKLISVLASKAARYFAAAAKIHLPEHGKEADFDCRVFQVPTFMEVYNNLLWRQQDAVRNSVLMLTQGYYSSKEMHGKKQPDCHEMLHAVGVNWADQPEHFKEGIFVKRQVYQRPFTTEEIAKLPMKHHARTNPNLTVERSLIAVEQQTLSKLKDPVQWLLASCK